MNRRLGRAAAIIAAVLVLPGTALAQLEGEEEQPPPPQPIEEEPPPVREEPPPQPVRRSAATAAYASQNGVAKIEGDHQGPRPEVFSTGIGFGWDFPAALDSPDITSVRFRLVSGLIFEPILIIQAGGTAVDQPGDNTESGNFTFTVGTNVRVPFAKRGRFDFVGIGSAALSSSSNDPDGADNNTSQLVFALGWGLGIDLWYSAHHVFSFSAGNPLVLYQVSSQEIPDDEIVTTTTQFGAVFDPNITLMYHMFF